MEQHKEQSIQELFRQIVNLHGIPVYVTLVIDKDMKINILAVATDNEELKNVLELKQQQKFQNYFG